MSSKGHNEPLYCECGCGQVLIGKQRRFASHAHQMRYRRRIEAESSPVTLPKSDEIQPRQVDVTLVVTAVFRVKWAGWMDDGLINKPMREKIAQAIGALLRNSYRDCVVLAVKVEKKGG